MSKEALKAKLLDFYTTFAEVPDETKLDKIVAQDRPEKDLFAALATKYNVDVAVVEKRRQDASRVIDFYEQYAPQQVAKVPQLLKKSFKGEIKPLLNALRNKYNVSEEDFPNEARGDAPQRKPVVEEPPVVKKQAPITPIELSASLSPSHPTPPTPTPTPTPPIPTPTQAVVPANPATYRVATPVAAAPTAVSTEGIQRGVKEETLLLREASLRALEAAIEVKASSFASLPRTFNATAFQRDPGEYSSAAAADYVEQLASIEAGLLKRCTALQELNYSVTKQKRNLDQEEADYRARAATFQRDLEDFLQTRRVSEDALSTARATLRANEADVSRKMEEARAVEARLEDRAIALDARELSCKAKEATLASREAGLEERLAITNNERDLAQKITTEVVSREATVRAVEKSMNDARRELSAIEVEVSKRAKQLATDEASVRNWAASLEEREVKLEEKLNLLKKKGATK